MAELISSELKEYNIKLNSKAGLDHGVWSVLKKMYPLADIPVVQLSIDLNASPEYHYKIGEKIRFLREKNVLIIGSGSLVHNLGDIEFTMKKSSILTQSDLMILLKRK